MLLLIVDAAAAVVGVGVSVGGGGAGSSPAIVLADDVADGKDAGNSSSSFGRRQVTSPLLPLGKTVEMM